jgi:hypothetical protein
LNPKNNLSFKIKINGGFMIFKNRYFKLSTFKNANLNYNIFIIFIAVSASLLILYNTSKYGASLTPDSFSYITTAEKLLDNPLKIFSNDKRLATWPHFYSVILATFSKITFSEPVKIAHYLNSILIFFFFLTAGMILNYISKLQSISIILLMTLLLLNKIPLIYINAWSEGLFLLLINIYILIFLKYYNNHPNKLFILLSIITCLLSLTRYIGISFIFPVLYLAYFSKKKFKNLFKTSVLAGIPFILY